MIQKLGQKKKEDFSLLRGENDKNHSFFSRHGYDEGGKVKNAHYLL